MTPDKRKKLKKVGWKVSSANEFLGLSAAKSAHIIQKPALSKSLKNKRVK
jgi:hypothetical protein